MEGDPRYWQSFDPARPPVPADPRIRTVPGAAPVTRALIVINAGVFMLQAIAGPMLIAMFALWPLGRFLVPDLGIVGFRPWQLVTSAFLHANVAHLFLNMFALHMFGDDVERVLGSRRYLVLYFAAVLSAACVQLLVVSARYTAPQMLNELLARKDFKGVYVELTSASVPADPAPRTHVRYALRARRARERRLPDAGGGRTLRASRRHARRLDRAAQLATARRREMGRGAAALGVVNSAQGSLF